MTEGVSCAFEKITSQFCAIRALAASCSLAGSNQEFTQMTFSSALVFTLRMPRTNALIPWRTSGIGKAATYPATFFVVILPATMPVRYRAS